MTPEQSAIVDFFKSTLDITDILSFVSFFDDSVNNGSVVLYPWQKKMQRKLSGEFNASNPLEQAICAVNGSGKDKYIIAPLVTYKLCTSVRSRCIITSSSSSQVTSQTEPSIKALAHNVNRVMKDMLGIEEFIVINQRYITCPILGSEIKLFATDEAGRAEGFHPWEKDSEMVLVMNEAKSIEEEIFGALTRCTGYNIWLEISSPGRATGHFYESCTSGHMDVDYVRADECSHISDKNLEKAKRTFGENSAIYRSMKYASFTGDDENTVFSDSCIEKNLTKPPKKDLTRFPLRAGIDVAAGGDENIVSIWQGNTRIAQDAFRHPETAESAHTIIAILEKHGFTKKNVSDLVTIDDGGIGRGVSSMLHMEGWMVRRVLNQSAATMKREFGNKGAELWFNFQRLVEEGFLILPKEDELFMKQVRERSYKYKNGAKIFLESKIDARSKGRKSPDRADAAVLANSIIGIADALEERESGKVEKDDNKKYRAESLLEKESVVTPGSILKGIYGNKYKPKYGRDSRHALIRL